MRGRSDMREVAPSGDRCAEAQVEGPIGSQSLESHALTRVLSAFDEDAE